MASVEKLNPRNRKTRRSKTGLASVSSQMTKATKLTAATIARPTIESDPKQSCSRAVSSMVWKAPTDTTSRIVPKVPMGAFNGLVSHAEGRVLTPQRKNEQTGRLRKKIHGQQQ